MKKTILFSSVLVALAMLASCQKEEFIETPATATGVTEFTATIESTKTTIASDGKVTWTAGDEITVTDAESKSAVYVAASSASSTTFTLKTGETAVGSGPYTATYGDITKQVYDANGANCPLSAGKTTGTSTNLQFSSPYAVLKITAQSSNAEVIKTVAVTYGNNSYYLDCSEKNVALTSTGVDFYVAVEPAKSPVALGVAFYNTADKMAKKTRNESISLNAKDLFPVKFDLSSSTWTIPTTTNTFKAVYKGDDGTLTFYYDNSLHIGEGVLYDNLPAGATAYTNWGYNGILGNIKSVKIDPSVEGYKGLTSTAYMFFNMTKAESISGAQYLDVSNVTDMTYMFCAYGKESTSLTAPPDVSGWKTNNVEKMGNLFSSYGQTSTSLTAPPDVSNWNTGNVTNMSNMFSSYGKYSNSLTDVPVVSGWKTDNVTDMGNLFANYGDANKNNINCVLDLTGWNLANLAPNKNVFNNFSPNTFKVTIPAKTGENANLPEKWYGSGTSWFSPPKNKYFTPALAGVFSVSVTKKVHFSKGNLWYGPATEGASATFNFEAEQYSISSSWDANHVSNFYWSKTESVAYADSYNESGTSASDVFFTNATGFTVGGQTNVWRTLSHDEWKYLFENHTYKYVSVKGKHGIVIAPDGFSGTIADSYDATAWATAESNGFVFLPNTGFRNNGTGISETDKSCFYWTSTALGVNDDNNPTAYRMFFQWKDSSLDYNFDNKGERQWAIGIRLVTE